MPPPYALDCLIRDPTVALDLCPNCSVGFYDSVVVTDVFSRNVELCHSRSVGFCDPIVTMEFWSGRNDGWFKQSDGIGFNRSDGTTPAKKKLNFIRRSDVFCSNRSDRTIPAKKKNHTYKMKLLNLTLRLPFRATPPLNVCDCARCFRPMGCGWMWCLCYTTCSTLIMCVR